MFMENETLFNGITLITLAMISPVDVKSSSPPPVTQRSLKNFYGARDSGGKNASQRRCGHFLI